MMRGKLHIHSVIEYKSFQRVEGSVILGLVVKKSLKLRITELYILYTCTHVHTFVQTGRIYIQCNKSTCNVKMDILVFMYFQVEPLSSKHNNYSRKCHS